MITDISNKFSCQADEIESYQVCIFRGIWPRPEIQSAFHGIRRAVIHVSLRLPRWLPFISSGYWSVPEIAACRLASDLYSKLLTS